MKCTMRDRSSRRPKDNGVVLSTCLVEVISGLVAGENVVVEGALKLRDGTEIKLINQPTEVLPSETDNVSQADGKQES